MNWLVVIMQHSGTWTVRVNREKNAERIKEAVREFDSDAKVVVLFDNVGI